MSGDPIASDPALLWTWTRIVIALVIMLGVAVGMNQEDVSSVILP